MRGLVGFIKHHFSYKDVPFNISYFLTTMLSSGMIGLLSAVTVKESGFLFLGGFDPSFAFIVGYAGGDFIENLYKIILKKPSLYSFKKE